MTALNTRNSGPPAIRPSIYQDLLDKRKEYRTFYALLLTVAIMAVILQIALGIIISSLSGIDPAGHKVAIIVLGATNTFVGFVSGWIQYQGWVRPFREYSRFQDAHLSCIAVDS